MDREGKRNPICLEMLAGTGDFYRHRETCLNVREFDRAHEGPSDVKYYLTKLDSLQAVKGLELRFKGRQN